MLRVCLIGPGDIEFHYQNLLGLEKAQLEKEIKNIADSLYESDVEIALLPDKGISLEVAKIFKTKGGKVIGLVPQSDKSPGINHLKQYLEERVNNTPLFDEIIDTGDWPKHDLTMALFGDIVLCLGLSPGTDGERSYGIYMYKIVTGVKPGVSQSIEAFHKEARAGKTVPYTILVYSPFTKAGKVSTEESDYAERFKVNLRYADSSKQLKEILEKLSK